MSSIENEPASKRLKINPPKRAPSGSSTESNPSPLKESELEELRERHRKLKIQESKRLAAEQYEAGWRPAPGRRGDNPVKSNHKVCKECGVETTEKSDTCKKCKLRFMGLN